MTQRSTAILSLIATALVWSSGGLAIKLVDWHPMAITGVRSALAAATLLLVLRARLSLRLWRYTRMQWAAAVSNAGMLICSVVAVKLTTAANAIFLAYTAPLYVALLAPWLLKERTSRRDWGFMALILAGMALFFMDGLSPAGWWGNVAAMGSGLSYACFTMSMRAQMGGAGSASESAAGCGSGADQGRTSAEAATLAAVEAVILGHVLTALCGLPFCFSTMPDAGGWLGLLYLGVIQQGLSLWLYSWAVTRLGALETILIMTLEPICNPIWVALGHGEAPGPWALVGGALVLAAVTGRGVAGAIRRAPRGTAKP